DQKHGKMQQNEIQRRVKVVRDDILDAEGVGKNRRKVLQSAVPRKALIPPQTHRAEMRQTQRPSEKEQDRKPEVRGNEESTEGSRPRSRSRGKNTLHGNCGKGLYREFDFSKLGIDMNESCDKLSHALFVGQHGSLSLGLTMIQRYF